ncbi:hypothetical protein GQ43DRAFT_118778 [Delitschia confertaspora ATCC 74209]|uniref:Zn(2)-C6 fungal-type domain-containing protein n=1 Tax=Delitschia confertaspora ATCC 74209 TaxID=1513339 RepID=A0A9P4JM73_9PLEO|nr:hypothetical protein GQ43DRAFT_118778 [Delitschia confertaspora ATCC 74209]
MYPPPHTGGHGQLPTYWSPQPPQNPQHHQQSASSPNTAQPITQSSYPPPSPAEPPPNMTSVQPQPPPGYRLPAPHEIHYRAPPPADPYARPPPPNYMNHGHQPPAPRQRTAIACRYCRRRKIRCTGFEATEDGRCGNCLRFNQECIFTPVSAQAQAFVPAHTVWRGIGQGQPPPQLYGAYGQPLPPNGHAPPPEQYGQPPPHGQQYLPSPTGPYEAHSSLAPPPGAAHEGGNRDASSSSSTSNSRKRPYTEPHMDSLPPMHTASSSQPPPQKSARAEYTYPDPTTLTTGAVSPATAAPAHYSSAPSPYSAAPYTGTQHATSHASYAPPYQSAPAPAPAGTPYYGAPPAPRRSSPLNGYAYDANRTSSSPNNQGPPSTPGTAPYYATPPADTTLRPLPPRSDGRTPPPPAGSSTSRPGMRITDIVSDTNRSGADRDMLNALNRSSGISGGRR